MCLKFPLSPYTMLRTHNIAWRKLRSLFLNIVKRGKGRETQKCPNCSFSHNFCHWLQFQCWGSNAEVYKWPLPTGSRWFCQIRIWIATKEAALQKETHTGWYTQEDKGMNDQMVRLILYFWFTAPWILYYIRMEIEQYFQCPLSSLALIRLSFPND